MACHRSVAAVKCCDAAHVDPSADGPAAHADWIHAHLLAMRADVDAIRKAADGKRSNVFSPWEVGSSSVLCRAQDDKAEEPKIPFEEIRVVVGIIFLIIGVNLPAFSLHSSTDLEADRSWLLVSVKLSHDLLTLN